jgi:membrane-associated phospholipid phosphatase
MDSLLDFGVEATRWLRENYPGLGSFMAAYTDLGAFEVYIALLPLIYWSIHKNFGRQLFYLIALANLSVEMLKHTFRGPRPYWLDSSFGFADEPTYGIPSGHVTVAFTAYLSIAAWIEKRAVWLLAIFMGILMAISRIYLGEHFIHDVLAGLVLAVILLAGAALWRRYGLPRLSERILGQKMLVAIAFPLFLALLYVIIRLVIGPADLSLYDEVLINSAELSATENVVAGIASLFGIGIGFVLEQSRIRFRSEGPLPQRALRFLVGIAGVIAIYFGLRAVFPTEPLAIGLPLRFARYFAATFFAAYYAPWLFVRLGLASADPDLGIQVGMRKNLLKDQE